MEGYLQVGLNSLAQEDVIAVAGKHIRIMDKERLEKISENG